MRLGHRDAKASREAFTRLWLTEGIPYAFSECPAVYEEIRHWLASRLNLHPKDITLIGSARIGFCLGEELGRSFSAKSDLDFSVISVELFSKLQTAFSEWRKDYDAAIIQPSSTREERYWNDNKTRVPTNLKDGFIDPHKIPNRNPYPLAKDISQTLFELKLKLDQTPSAPCVSRASIRVYRDWKSLITRVSFNLYHILRERQSA